MLTSQDDPHGGAFVLRITGLPPATYELERVCRIACSSGAELGVWLGVIKGVLSRLRGEGGSPGGSSAPPPLPRKDALDAPPIVRSHSDLSHLRPPPSSTAQRSDQPVDLGGLHPFAAAAFERDDATPSRTRFSDPPSSPSLSRATRRSIYTEPAPGADAFARAPLPPPPPFEGAAPSPAPLRRPRTAPTRRAPAFAQGLWSVVRVSLRR